MITGSYLVLMLISGVLLYMPFSLQPGASLSMIDALFTATSALTVTGLTVTNTAETFSLTGQLILLITIQLGGIGIMTLSTMVWVLLGRKIGLRDRLLIQLDQNQVTLSGLVRLTRHIFMFVLVIEALGALILGTYFLQFYAWDKAYYMGLFHAVSGFTHAGFDLFGDSLLSFRHDYVVNVTVMGLIFCGAIGFPVLMELYHYPSRRRLSLHSKLSLLVYVLLWAAGLVFIFGVEYNASLKDDAWHQKLLVSAFQSLTARSTGLATTDVSAFQLPTLLFMSLLMFVGASPSSSGGGIRTTTLATILLAVKAYAKGERDVSVFGRQLDPADVRKAFVVVVFGVALLVLALTVLTMTEPFAMEALVFDAASAFGTTGLSVGVTEQFSAAGKLVLMVLMLTGRIGFGAILLLVQTKEKKALYRYPKERIIIG